MAADRPNWANFIKAFRVYLTRTVAIVFFGGVVFTEHAWPEDGLVDTAMELMGILLITAGTFGRLWCTLFISGYKNKQLVTEGPYSVCRNPLYFFSFLGAVGVALATEMFSILAMVVLLFGLYYPVIIQLEEEILRRRHPMAFEAYVQRVPRFLPKLSLLREPASYTFDTVLFRRAVWDCMWFFIAYAALEIMEHLHGAHVLPVWIRLY